ncbi:MAG: choice-of-anchor tandem repeat NxxGxxAF-containing protein, partial [Pirellulales bacterium]
MNGRAWRAIFPGLRACGLFLLAPLSFSLLISPVVAGEFAFVAQSGQPSPDGNGNLVLLTVPALSDAGQVAFLSQLSGTNNELDDNIALYRGTAAGLTVVARKGVTQVDTNPFAGFVNNNPAINAAGTVSHSATLTSPTETVDFLGSGGPITVLPRVGTASPSGNNQLVSRSLPVINNAGVTAYRASYSGTNQEIGLYSRAADGTLTTRLLQGVEAPHGGTIFSVASSLPTLNESAQIALTASVDDGLFTQKAALRLDGTTVVELARDGDSATNASTTINSILSNAVPLNDSGQVAFTATYVQPTVSGPGVFRADASGATLIAPTTLPGSATAAASIRLAAINNAGQVAFAADFVGGGDPLSGIYLADTGAPTLVALEDTAVPGGGKFFRRFFGESISLNNAGQIAFVAELSDTSNGPAAGRGLFLYGALSGLQQIIRTGQSLSGATLTALGFTGAASDVNRSPDPNFSGLNSGGQLAFNFSLSSGASGIAIWSDSIAQVLGDYNHNGIVDAADYS